MFLIANMHLIVLWYGRPDTSQISDF